MNTNRNREFMEENIKELIFQGQNQDEPIVYGFINKNEMNAQIEISGRVLCEQYCLRNFHVKITSWILNYIYDSSFWFNNTDLTIKFKIEYSDSSGLFTIGLLFRHLENLIEGWAKFKELKIKILWFYPSNDEDLKEYGKIFKETYKLNFELVKEKNK